MALRSIRDFSKGFKEEEEIYWKYFTYNEEIIPKPRLEEVKIEIQKKEPEKETKIKQKESEKELKIQKKPLENKKIKIESKKETEFNNPLIIKKETKTKKTKAKSEFVQKIINTLKNNYQIIEEKDYKPKEYNCLIKANSDLGPMIFLTQAKDKKSISETDLKKLLSDSQSIPLPALFIYTGKLSKKAKEFAEQYISVLKIKKVA